MSDQANSAESIFGQAIEIQSDDDRVAFVEQLVADHFRAGSFLEEPVMQDVNASGDIGSSTTPQPP